MDILQLFGQQSSFDIPTIITSALGLVFACVYLKPQGKTERAVVVSELLLLLQSPLMMAALLTTGATSAGVVGLRSVFVLLAQLLRVALSAMLFVVIASAMTEGRDASRRVLAPYLAPAALMGVCLLVPQTRDLIYTVSPEGDLVFQGGYALMTALSAFYAMCCLAWEWRYRKMTPRVTQLAVGVTVFVAVLFAADCLMGTRLVPFGLSVVFTAFVCAMGQIYGDRWESENAALARAATTDPLTGLLNRRGFEEHALEMLAEPGNQRVALFMADLDDFKIFNDRYGHRAGDTVLKDFARKLSDIFGEGAVIARTGGDEFIVLIEPNERVLDRACTALQGEYACSYEGVTIRYRASAGYTLHDKAGAVLEELCRQSDLALYHGKVMRDGLVSAYDVSMELDAREQLGFSARDLSESVPAGLLICQNDESKRVLFANERCLDAFGCATVSELVELSQGDFRNLLPEGEFDRVKATVFKLAPKEDDGWVEADILTKGGDRVPVYAVGHSQHTERFGEMLCILIFRV